MSGLRVVLLGVIGSGKTSLFNLLTSNNEPTYSGGPSVTKQIVVGTTNIGEQFEIIDTPGFESDEDKLLHAAGVIAALTIGNVNRILAITKFERDGKMMNSLSQIIAPLTRFRDKITILVSHWDLSQNKEEDGKHLQKKIKDRFNIGSVLFYSNKDNAKNITTQIIEIISQSQFTSIKLQDTEIYTQFDLLGLNCDNETKLNENKEKILRQFRKTANIFIKYINQLKNLNDPKIVDILHYMSLEIKKIANDQIEQFEKQHGEEIVNFCDTNGNNARYLHYIYLKKEIKKDLEYVIQLAQSKMIQSQNHCFQWLKQCPNCKLIWIKVAGCDGETTCGRRVFSKSDAILQKSQTFCKFKFKIHQDNLVVEENKLPSQISKQKSLPNNIYDYLKSNFNFQQIFGKDLSQDELENVLTQKFGQVFWFHFKILYSSRRDEFNERIIQDLHQLFNLQEYENKQSKNKYFGCGYSFVWSELPPLKGPELKELLTTELIDYFSDQKQLIADENQYLEKTYKDLINQAIDEQFKNKKTLQKQQQQQQ